MILKLELNSSWKGTNDFNYSLVDAKTKEFLEERANIIYGIQSKSAYEIGKQLAKARLEVMVASKNGIEAYEYINHYNFVCSQNNNFF